MSSTHFNSHEMHKQNLYKMSISMKGSFVVIRAERLYRQSRRFRRPAEKKSVTKHGPGLKEL